MITLFLECKLIQIVIQHHFLTKVKNLV